MAEALSEGSHAHPCGFRLTRRLDRGWGEAAFEYRWDSTDRPRENESQGLPELAHCTLYELTRYDGNEGRYDEQILFPPDPPFVGWRFRNPTDGRSGPVGMERFPASQGWAWDRHKLGGSLVVPEICDGPYVIRAVQEYRFHCAICGVDGIVPGPDAGPHTLVRSFSPLAPDTAGPRSRSEDAVAPESRALHHDVPSASGGIWRYSFLKHDHFAWMDLTREGYVDDSLHLGFGPW